METFANSSRRLADMVEQVKTTDPDILLATPIEDIVDDLFHRYDIEPITLHPDRMEQLPTAETQIDISQDRSRMIRDRSRPFYVAGSVVSVAVPFEGDAWLLKLRPSSWVMADSYAKVQEGELVVDYPGVDPTPEQVKRGIESQLDIIRRNVDHIRTQVDEFNARLPAVARSAAERRREKLLKDRGLEGALGVRMRRRGDAPQPVPIKRKRLGVRRPTAATARRYEDEYRMDDAQYEEIIDIILSMGRALERSPATFTKLSEEELRDHLLLQLNGTFEGHAAGEMFNGEGKTDILVRVEDRNVFIAECKIWRGPTSFRKAIDQLLSYLVWRDTKAALILFIKGGNATDVIEKAVSELRGHACYKRDGAPRDDTRVNVVLHQPDDPDREINVALIPVVIPDPTSPGDEVDR